MSGFKASQHAESLRSTEPDLILHNGTVITLDAGSRIVQALAIGGERIQALGGNREILALAGPATRLVDLGGRTLIPGLIDAHFRLLDRAAAQYCGADVSLSGSIAEVLEAVREAAARLPRGELITSNSGWYPHMLAEGRPPTRQELDAAAPDHPVALRGEFVYANSAALARAGIHRDTPQTAFGWIEKDPRSGEPTGVVMGDAAKPLHALRRPLGAEEKERVLIRALQDCARAGITSIREGGITPAELGTHHRLYREGRLPIRVSAQLALDMSPPLRDIIDGLAGHYPGNPIGDHWFRIDRVGYIFADDDYNRLGLSTPIRNQPVPAERLRRFQQAREAAGDKVGRVIEGIASLGLSAGILAGGDAMIDQVLDQLEAAHARYPLADRRWVLSQLVYPKQRHLARMRALGLVLTPMWHHYYYYPALETYHGRATAQTMDPFRMLLEAGIHVGLGSDVAQLPLNYFTALYFLHTRETWRWGPCNPDQAISREQALRLMTVDNAYVSFEEAHKGSLEPGKLADMVVLSADPLSVPAEQIPSIHPLLTLVGGRTAYRHPDWRPQETTERRRQAPQPA